jgi:hypothetical protein
MMMMMMMMIMMMMMMMMVVTWSEKFTLTNVIESSSLDPLTCGNNDDNDGDNNDDDDYRVGQRSHRLEGIREHEACYR